MATTQQPPLPFPPFFTIPNISNLRDAALSPLTTSTNLSLHPRLLFRSASPTMLTPSGWTSLHALGIAHVFDLRSAPELAKEAAGIVGPSGPGISDVPPACIAAMRSAGVQRTWVPVFSESDYSPERLAERYVKYMDEDVEGFVAAYRDIVGSGGEAFGRILRYLVALKPPATEAEKDGDGKGKGEARGALIHCTAGKDRTGMFFGILLDFLGVPREQIAEEYHLTELGLRHVREEVVARLMQSPGFKKYVAAQMARRELSTDDIAKSLDGEVSNGQDEVQISPEILEKGRQAALRMIGARKESMLKALEMVDETFGGAEAYMRNECGLSDGDLEKLRQNLLIGR